MQHTFVVPMGLYPVGIIGVLANFMLGVVLYGSPSHSGESRE